MKKLYLLSIISLLIASGVYAESLTLNISPGYPQNGTYVFACTPQDFNATSFDWNFGDGVAVPGISGLVQHTFVAEGPYVVTCNTTGTNGTVSQSLPIFVNFSVNNN